MKASGIGIIRYMDELGRIVIPKEFRKTLKLHEGTPIEMFIGDNGEIILKQHFTHIGVKIQLEELYRGIHDLKYEDTYSKADLDAMENHVQAICELMIKKEGN